MVCLHVTVCLNSVCNDRRMSHAGQVLHMCPELLLSMMMLATETKTLNLHIHLCRSTDDYFPVTLGDVRIITSITTGMLSWVVKLSITTHQNQDSSLEVCIPWNPELKLQHQERFAMLLRFVFCSCWICCAMWQQLRLVGNSSGQLFFYFFLSIYLYKWGCLAQSDWLGLALRSDRSITQAALQLKLLKQSHCHT